MKEIKARKTKQGELNREYKRLLGNLKRRLKRLEKQGIDLNFPVPSQPKHITQGSINRLLDLTNQLNYITGRGKVNAEKLPGYLSKVPIRTFKKEGTKPTNGWIDKSMPTSPRGKSNNKSIVSDWLQDDEATRKKLEEVNKDNKDFIDWINITGGGIEIPPDMSGSEIAALYEICEDAVRDAQLFATGGDFIKFKAEKAIAEMNGVNAATLWELFSIYVQAAGYEKVADKLVRYIYDSRDNEELLREVIDDITTEPSSMNAIQRQQVARLKERFSYYFH